MFVGLVLVLVDPRQGTGPVTGLPRGDRTIARSLRMTQGATTGRLPILGDQAWQPCDRGRIFAQREARRLMRSPASGAVPLILSPCSVPLYDMSAAGLSSSAARG